MRPAQHRVQRDVVPADVAQAELENVLGFFGGIDAYHDLGALGGVAGRPADPALPGPRTSESRNLASSESAYQPHRSLPADGVVDRPLHRSLGTRRFINADDDGTLCSHVVPPCSAAVV